MYNLPLMQVLNPLEHLITKHEGTLEGHDLIAINKNILNAGAQQIHEHNIVLPLSSDSMHFGDSNYAGGRVEVLVHFCLEVQLWEFGVDLL